MKAKTQLTSRTQSTNEEPTPTSPLEENVLALTPGTDFVFNFREDQYVWARHGNDYIVPFNPSSSDTTGFNIDVIFGDLLDEQQFPQFANDLDLVAPGRDTFVLGDWRTPYYFDGGFPGVRQFAIITDFSTTDDTVELYGSSTDYLTINNLEVSLQGTTVQGSALLYTGKNPETGRRILGDLVAFFPAIPELGATEPPDLSVDGDYFEYQGTTPPGGPISEEIKQLGTIGLDGAFSSSADSFGNLYVVGATSGSLGGLNAGSFDAWIAKYDKDGNQEWIKQIGTTEADTAFGIRTFVTDTGETNFYVQGTTTGNLGGQNEGYQDLWVGRFDSNGDQVWIQQNPQPFPGPRIDNSLKLDVDEHGNLYQAGISVVENPPGSAFPVSDNSFVAKYDPDGNLIWSKEFTSSGNTFDETYGITTTNDGGVYATGWTRSDLGGAPIGAYDTWLAKLDSEGEQEWIAKLGSENYEFPWGVDNDSHDNAYVAGWTRGTLEVGGSDIGVSQTNSDAWLTKYDSTGSLVWTRQFGTSGDDGLFLGGIKVDSNDDIFVTGFTDNDLGGTNAGSYDVFVAKYASDGEQLWIQQFGTSDFEYPSEITVNNTGDVFVTGYSQGSLGDINLGSVDAWIAKLDGESGNLKAFNPNSGSGVNPSYDLFAANNSQRVNDSGINDLSGILFNNNASLLGGRSFDARTPNTLADNIIARTLESTINLAPLAPLLNNIGSVPAAII